MTFMEFVNTAAGLAGLTAIMVISASLKEHLKKMACK